MNWWLFLNLKVGRVDRYLHRIISGEYQKSPTVLRYLPHIRIMWHNGLVGVTISKEVLGMKMPLGRITHWSVIYHENLGELSPSALPIQQLKLWGIWMWFHAKGRQRTQLSGDSPAWCSGRSRNHTPQNEPSFSLDDTVVVRVFFYFSDPGYDVSTSTVNPHSRENKPFEIEIAQSAKHTRPSVWDFLKLKYSWRNVQYYVSFKSTT